MALVANRHCQSNSRAVMLIADDPVSKSTSEEPMLSELNKEIVYQMFAALNAGDGAKYLSFMAEDVKITYFGDHVFSGTYIGKADFLQNFVPALRSRLEGGIKLQIKNIIAENDQVVVECDGEAKTKTGLDYNNLYCIVLRLKNNKVTEVREYMDTALTRAVFG